MAPLALTLAALLSQERADVHLDEWDPELPVEAQRETEEARSATRLHVAVSFGIVSDPLAPGGGGPSVGPVLIVGKPLYLGTRRRWNQFVLEARIIAGWVPSKYALLAMMPAVGINFYFGRYVGLEGRAGLGAGARLSNASHFGISTYAEGAFVLRVLGDDRRRIKAFAGYGSNLFFDNGSAGLNGWLGLAYETPL